ncbi:MAG: hypothetical protein EZS28_015900 [Streblomastix strix]|uniref:Uncharacterized protein n=1 Tax=Streblomastix strix TaxID=222440 RepID=A0A5J4W282_9EUKA|nr:MAG: hypothetical protein EZS28_015900 [Streblomastix strix]
MAIKEKKYKKEEIKKKQQEIKDDEDDEEEEDDDDDDYSEKDYSTQYDQKSNNLRIKDTKWQNKVDSDLDQLHSQYSKIPPTATSQDLISAVSIGGLIVITAVVTSSVSVYLVDHYTSQTQNILLAGFRSPLLARIHLEG